MPGIISLRKYFQGGGADMGGAPDSKGNVGASFGGGNEGQFSPPDRTKIKEIQDINTLQSIRDARIDNMIRKGGNIAFNLLAPTPVKLGILAARSYPRFSEFMNTRFGTNLPEQIKFGGAPERKLPTGGGDDRINQAFTPFNIYLNQLQEDDDFDPFEYEMQLRQNLNPEGIMGLV